MSEMTSGENDGLRMPPRTIQIAARRGAPRTVAAPRVMLDLDSLDRVHAVRDYARLIQRSAEIGSGEYLVEGLVPKGVIGILVGDSGLGKSPLLYQMAICVAAGAPFLGRRVCRGSTLYMDFENGMNDTKELVERLSSYLGLEGVPPDLHFWHFSDCSENYGCEGYRLRDIVQGLRPVVVFVDSLGAYLPEVEDKNSIATRLAQDLRSIARDAGSTILCVHHLRKPSSKPEEAPASLEGEGFRNWFQQARGPRALINATDVRLGVDLPRIGPTHHAPRENTEEPALIVRGFGRMRGDTGLIYLTRVLDDEGEPIGYKHVIGIRLLFNPDQETALSSLNQAFTFGEAKRIYGRRDQATTDFLKKCVGIGLVRKTGRGQYEKVQVPE